MKPAWKSNHAFISITLVFFFSRFAFWLAGVQFYGSFAHRMWQLLDLEWLRTRFFESIFYCHSQPPLFNALTGTLVKIFPHHYYLALHIVMLFFSWAVSLMLYKTLRCFKVTHSISISTAIFFLLNPALVLYENLYSYTLMTIFIVTGLVFFLGRFIVNKRFADWCFFWSFAAALCLTRSSFHLVWLVLLIVLLWKIIPSLPRFKIAVLFAIIIVSGLYVKNFILFDSFSSSSWFGMNVARLVTPRTTMGTIGPFKAIASYGADSLETKRYPEVIALSREFKEKGYINFNHYGFIEVSRRFRREVMEEIRRRPDVYLSSVGNAFIAYFTPATHAPFVDRNFVAMSVYARAMTLDFSKWKRYDRNSLTTTAALPAFLIYILVLVTVSIRGRTWFAEPGMKLTVHFLLMMLAYGMLVGNLLEYGENNRFRFETHTCFLILLALLIDQFLKKFRNSCQEKGSM